MEATVIETILTHLKRSRQFGFLGGRSTILQLLTFLDICAEAISRGYVTDEVYLDFQKAFDTFHIKGQAPSIWHKWGHPKLDQCFPKWHSLNKRSGTPLVSPLLDVTAWLELVVESVCMYQTQLPMTYVWHTQTLSVSY